MNRLKPERQAQVIEMLCEGNSIRSTERMTGVHRNTIMRLLPRVGNACAGLMNERMRNLSCKRIQIDEIWTFVGKKQRRLGEKDDLNRTGDFWTYVALDPDSKVVPSYLVGKRTTPTTHKFIEDLASRLKGRVQLSSDHLAQYVKAVEKSFGENVDYGRIVKIYETASVAPGKYSPPHVARVNREAVSGAPETEHISTSIVERHNLTMRTCMRRFTRLTLGFSKKPENLKAAVDIHMAYYNFVRPHKTIGTTPAIAAGAASVPWSIQDLIWMAS